MAKNLFERLRPQPAEEKKQPHNDDPQTVISVAETLEKIGWLNPDRPIRSV